MSNAKHTLQFSYDGFGINDASDPYRARILTFAKVAHDSETAARHDEIGNLIAAAPELLTVAQIAYAILGDVRHQWAGRHTAEGQASLAALRDVIAKATGRDPQDVQDEYCNAAIAKARG